jgi:hypothetical protein
MASATRPSPMLGIRRSLRLSAYRAISGLAAAFHVVVTALLTFMFPEWYGPNRKYRPGQHYMRGPGPKCRAKRGV